ncbi:MAG: hypothetical protein SF052_16890 [Bacteroidia bacterium]|nr:hypothetical protein [Bacteroidia bacterium]
MKDRQRIITLYFETKAFENGSVDVTTKLYEIVPEDQIEGIKYIVPSSTEQGIYFTIVIVEKKEKQKGILGFNG